MRGSDTASPAPPRSASVRGGPPSPLHLSLAINLFTLAALAAWFGLARTVPDYQLPGPEAVFRRMPDFLLDPALRLALATTFGHVLAAFSIAFVIGCLMAVTAYRVPLLRVLIDARLTPFLNAFSGIGWLFMAILWFGINSTTVIFTVTMILIPFTAINIRTGLNELDRELLELGQSLTLSAWRPVGMSDARWQQLRAAHEAEILLVKSQIESRKPV